MRAIGTFTKEPTPGDLAALTRPNFIEGGQHLVNLGIGMSMLVTTAELADWLDQLDVVLGDCRVADLRAAMEPLPEVAQ